MEGGVIMKPKTLNILFTLFLLSIFSIAFSSPLDDYTENVKNDSSNSVALYTPVNKNVKNIDDNTLFVIHIDVGSKESIESYQPENNTVLRGFERGVNSYVNIFNNFRNRNVKFFRRR